MEKVMKNIFLKLIFNTKKIYITFKNGFPCLPERMKTEKVEKLVVNLKDR